MGSKKVQKRVNQVVEDSKKVLKRFYKVKKGTKKGKKVLEDSKKVSKRF